MDFLSRFNAQVERTPDAIAVYEQGRPALSYRALQQAAARLAGRLLADGIAPEDRVGLEIDKSPDYLVAVLGCWWAGASYVPLPLEWPEARRQEVAERARLRCILAHADSDDHALPPAPAIPQDRLAYILFTSGSTGRPKGVMLEHRGLLPFLDAQIEAFGMREDTRSLFYLSTAFDASLSDIGTALLSGASLFIEDPLRLQAPDLVALLGERGITHADLPPSLLPWINPDDLPDCLETVVIGGEVCPPETVRAWAEHVCLVNVYGPTEATVCSSWCVCGTDWEHPLIGDPVPGTRFVLDGDELLIAGDGLARGYLDDPALTAERFVQHQGERMYRSGDRVRRLPNGDLEFLGRMDRQFKLNGKLVEPAEIEALLLEHPTVREAAVLRSGDRLIAHVAAADEDPLRTFLSERLPDWMVPGRFVHHPVLPRGLNQKIDYTALRAQAEVVNADSPMAGLWAEVLGQPVGDAQSLDELGVCSMDLLRIAALGQTRGLPLTPGLLLQHPSPAALKQALSRPAGQGMSTRALRAQAGAPVPRSATHSTHSHRVLLTGGTGFLGQRLLREFLERGMTVYALVRDPKRLPLRHKRLVPLRGDLALDRFGWDPVQWERMSERIDTVVHSGAEVHLARDFDALKAVNLDGTRRVLEFTADGPPKALHYMSTLSVLIATDRPRGTWLESDTLEGDYAVYGGYAQSKWAAEWLVRQSGPASIYRLGLLPFDEEDGRIPAHDLLPLTLRTLAGIGCYPEGEAAASVSFDFTPAAYAARAVVALMHQDPATFHIANPEPLSFHRLVEALELRAENPETFREALDDSPAGLALHRLLPNPGLEITRSLDLFQTTEDRFAQRNTLAGLKKRGGLACPQVDDQLLNRYLDTVLTREPAAP